MNLIPLKYQMGIETKVPSMRQLVLKYLHPATQLLLLQPHYLHIKSYTKIQKSFESNFIMNTFGSVQCGKSCKKHDEMKKLRLIKVSVDNEICNL